MSCGLMEVQCWPLWWKMGYPTNMQASQGWKPHLSFFIAVFWKFIQKSGDDVQILLKKKFFSQALFYQYQSLYIAPAVNDFWEQQKMRLWEERAGKDVLLSGDGRNDLPGHSAQYCTYSLADMNTMQSYR